MSEPDIFRVSFVCSGNICRSPMGEVILRRLAEEAGLGERFAVTSRGTGDWHVGQQAAAPARAVLATAGYDGEAHRAAQLTDADIAENDLLIALAREHERFMLDRGADPERLMLLTAFDPERPADPDVFDPYRSAETVYTRVLTQIERSCAVLFEELRTRVGE